MIEKEKPVWNCCSLLFRFFLIRILIVSNLLQREEVANRT